MIYASGTELPAPNYLKIGMTSVCTVRKRRIVGVEFFWDHAEALEAVGLAK